MLFMKLYSFIQIMTLNVLLQYELVKKINYTSNNNKLNHIPLLYYVTYSNTIRNIVTKLIFFKQRKDIQINNLGNT